MLETPGGTVFPINASTPSFAKHDWVEALETWRSAALLASERWRTFLEAEPEARRWAFASYAAALDAEEAAAADVAGLYSRRAA
jgi:hypothetical protein